MGYDEGDLEGLGEFLHNILNPGPEPGPPWVWIADVDEIGAPCWRLTNPDEETAKAAPLPQT